LFTARRKDRLPFAGEIEDEPQFGSPVMQSAFVATEGYRKLAASQTALAITRKVTSIV
jgi:hypothetical protein